MEKNNYSAHNTFWMNFIFYYLWGLITLGGGIILILVLHFEIFNEVLIYWASVFLGILFIYSIWSWRYITGSIFDAYTLFLISAVLFNAGEALLRSVNIGPSVFFYEHFCDKTVAETLCLVMLGLYAFHLGALVCGKMSLRIRYILQAGDIPDVRDVRLIGWILISLSFLPAFFYLQDSISHVMSYGYFYLYTLDFVTSFAATDQVLATFVVPGILFLLTGSRGNLSNRIISIILIVGFTSVRLFLGSRASAAMPMIVFVLVWHRYIYRIPRIFLFSGAMILIFLIFPLVGEIRNIPGQQRLSYTMLGEILFSIDNPIVSILSEMGSSIRTVAHTLELVPEVRSYDLGAGYLNAVFTVVPNLFWPIHPAIARGTASDWLVKTIDPLTAYLGGGMGYSFIAESYLNFGWLGCPIVLFAFGFAYAKLVFWAQQSIDIARIAMLASFLSFFLFFPRSESVVVIRPLIWYALVPYLMVLSIRYMKNIFRKK
jgi:oligosaccharide repeat unit polymerase